MAQKKAKKAKKLKFSVEGFVGDVPVVKNEDGEMFQEQSPDIIKGQKVLLEVYSWNPT